MKKIINIVLAAMLVFSLASCSVNNAEVLSEITEDVRILTIYFSAANTADADAVSSATPYIDSEGSAVYLAEYIHGKVGGDIAGITPVKDYPLSYNECAKKAKQEAENGERPEFQALDINPEDYDVVFVVYPMWHYALPMIMYTFFDVYDFSGKTIVPFNVHGGGEAGEYSRTFNAIKELEPKAAVTDGFDTRGSTADSSKGDIDKWLDGLNY